MLQIKFQHYFLQDMLAVLCILVKVLLITQINGEIGKNIYGPPFNFEPNNYPFTGRYAETATQIQTNTGYNFNYQSIQKNIPVIQINKPQCQQPKQLIGGKCVCPYTTIENGNNCVPLFDYANINGYSFDKINTYGYGSSNTPNIPITLQPSPITWRRILNFTKSINGTGNNIYNYHWGAKDTSLQRIHPAVYEDGQSKPISTRLNPRYISNIFGSAENPQTSQKKSTVLVAMWGQFMDHDIDLTPTQNNTYKQSMNIPIPAGDKIMDPNNTGQEFMRFTRSKFIQGSTPRIQVNQVTAWIDGSMIYGSDQFTSNNLRLHSSGKLKTSSENMLPKNPDGFFFGGDVRINENLPLTCLHTIFLRQHNRLAQIIAHDDPNLSDEQIFQIARAYVIGLISKITYDDWLPQILGKYQYQKYIGQYNGYDATINPSVLNEFSTAAFRLGHSLLPNSFFLLDQNFQKVKDLQLKQLFFKPSLFYQLNFFENLVRGLTRIKLKKRSCQISDGIRNFLIVDQNKLTEKFDLFSFNLQRGRDHGLPAYGELQQYLGFTVSQNFYQITNPIEAFKLQNLYRSPKDLDLWLGIVCEYSIADSELGKIGGALIGKMFRMLRDGDRFWYQKNLPQSIVSEIKSTTLSDIISRNSKVKNLQRNIFVSSSF